MDGTQVSQGKVEKIWSLSFGEDKINRIPV